MKKAHVTRVGFFASLSSRQDNTCQSLPGTPLRFSRPCREPTIKPLAPVESSGLFADGTRPIDEGKLDFFHCECALFADFHTAFAAQALILIHRFGLAVGKLEYIDGAYIYAFGVTSALVLVNRYFEAHFFLH
jgi:hypothetical protein